MKQQPEEKKVYPFPYDYWVDKEEGIVYAVVEYDDKKIDRKHSNLYLVSAEYHGR